MSELHDPNPYGSGTFNGSYTRLHMEAALCIWEEFLERRPYPLPADASPWTQEFDSFWEGLGSSAMRHISIDLASHALALYDTLTEEEQEEIGSYDWEFIPFFVSLTRWAKPDKIVPSQEELLAATREYLVIQRARRVVLHGK